MLLAAPIQEYTDAAFRNAHARTIGGIDEYYAPFIRLEHGSVPRRSELDIENGSNAQNTVPQILAKNADEAATLLQILGEHGFHRVDFNFGCPFPKLVKSGYGAGMLENPDGMRKLLELAVGFDGMRVSVKMRLGIADGDACMRLLPILNDMPLDKIVLHPRTAMQQYGGIPDKAAFLRFQDSCSRDVVYNGDVIDAESAAEFGNVMIGRGLLANPLLPLLMGGRKAPQGLLNAFHEAFVLECSRLYQQPLLKLKLLWDYFLPNSDKRLRKDIRKCRSVEEYMPLAMRLLADASQ